MTGFANLKREVDRLRILNWLHTIVPTLGNVYYVFNTSDSYYTQASRLLNQTYYDNTQAVHTSIASAYAATTSGRNDVILFDANSSHNVEELLTVAKNRVNFIGMDGGDRLIQQGTKIGLATANLADDVATTILNTGTRNRFENLKVTNEGTNANSITSFIDEGEGTIIKNCSFQKLSDLDETGVADFICRSDSATYINPEFGFDTLVQTVARATFLIQNSGATRMKNLRMVNPRFISANTSADKVHLKVANTSSLAFSNIIENPIFINTIISSLSAIQATVAAESASGLVEGTLLITNPHVQSASFSTTSDGFVVTGTPTATTNAFEGVTPA